MTEKRFNFNVNKNCIEYEGKHFAYCNGEQNKIANKLNELYEENTHIKNTIKEAYNNERTHIGKNVLKQLIEAIQ